jgi:hypothetical protein
MKRIGIEWNKKSMSEDTLKGIITVLEGKTTTTMTRAGAILIKVTKSTIHTKRMGGKHPLQLSDEHSELIHTMAKCYRAGMDKDPDIYHWIDL